MSILYCTILEHLEGFGHIAASKKRDIIEKWFLFIVNNVKECTKVILKIKIKSFKLKIVLVVVMESEWINDL